MRSPRSTPRTARRPRRGRPRPALHLRRHPRLWWAIVALTATAAAAMMATTVQRAEAARAAWRRPVTVVVARHDLPAGTVVDEGDVVTDERPEAVVPPGAVLDAPVGQRLRSSIHEGEVVLTARLAPEGTGPVAAAMPPGTRAVAVPADAGAMPPLQPGDEVDVLVALSPEAAGGGPLGFTVAGEVTVVHVTDVAVTIAVPVAAAPRVAVALSQGAVSLALAAP